MSDEKRKMHQPDTINGIAEFCAAEGQPCSALHDLIAVAREMGTLVYPRPDGETTVIGPQCFASKDRSVISWRGENYIRASIDSPRPRPRSGSGGR